MSFRKIESRDALGGYTREIIVPASAGVTPQIRRIVAMSNVMMGFTFFDGPTTDAKSVHLGDGAVMWGHPQGGLLEIDGEGAALIVGTEGRPIYVENRVAGPLSIFVS